MPAGLRSHSGGADVGGGCRGLRDTPWVRAPGGADGGHHAGHALLGALWASHLHQLL